MTPIHIFNLGTALFALIAAALWFASTKVNAGNRFKAVEFPISMLDEAQKLNDLGAAYNKQSLLNALAASAAALSAICQAVVVWMQW